MQLVYQEEQNVQFPYTAEPRCDLPEPSGEFARHLSVELEDRDQLAEAARRHACAMERLDVTLVDAAQRSCKAKQAALEEIGPGGSHRHGLRGTHKRVIIVMVCA
jgi:hypothetical protein